MVVKNGRFGPYVTDGETNASLRKGDDVDTLTVQRAAELLADRRASAPARPAARTTRRRPETGRQGQRPSRRREEAGGQGTGRRERPPPKSRSNSLVPIR